MSTHLDLEYMTLIDILIVHITLTVIPPHSTQSPPRAYVNAEHGVRLLSIS